MKKQQVIFDKIKAILIIHLNKIINEYENGSNLSLGDTGIWISFDEKELTIGYGFFHKHYDPEFDNMADAISEFFDLLTKRKKLTTYYKGSVQFKNIAEIEIGDNQFKYLGASNAWLYPFWKKSIVKVTFYDKLLDANSIQEQIDEIKYYAQQ